MLSKENTGKQVAGNQMDYVANESATVDYEDRLSGDISDGTWHSVLDDAASDEVMKKATFFVEPFVKKFEKKLSEYFEEAEPDSNIQKIGELGLGTTSIINNGITAGVFKLIISEICKRIILNPSAEKHREKAKRVHEVV